YLNHLAYCDRLPDLSTKEGKESTAMVLREYRTYKLPDVGEKWIDADIASAHIKQLQAGNLRVTIARTIAQLTEMLQPYVTGDISVSEYIKPISPLSSSSTTAASKKSSAQTLKRKAEESKTAKPATA